MNKAHLINRWQSLPWSVIALNANKFAPKLVFILVFILLVQSLAELTWSFFEDEETHVVAEGTQLAASNINNIKTDVVSLDQVVQYHLFGNATKKATLEHQKVISAPDTRLQLILQGVFASTNTKKALAIIATKKSAAKTYRIGDKLSGGAVLHAVYADRVILNRSGKLETLRLPKVETKNLYSKSVAKNTRSTKPVHRSQVSNKKLTALRETLLKDPSKIWQQVRINPVMKNGKVKGYSLLHNDKSLMKSLGIRKSDIILEVNGESLSNPSILYGLMNTLSKQKNLAITIERNGKKESIQLSF